MRERDIPFVYVYTIEKDVCRDFYNTSFLFEKFTGIKVTKNDRYIYELSIAKICFEYKNIISTDIGKNGRIRRDFFFNTFAI